MKGNNTKDERLTFIDFVLGAYVVGLLYMFLVYLYL